jgi:PAS domain S-box-containing protein
MTSLLPAPAPAVFPESPLQESTGGLIDLAASLCQTRFAVLRIGDCIAAVNDPAVPLDAEEVLAARAATRAGSLVVLRDADLEGVSGIRFYAAVSLSDPANGIHGTLSVLDDRPRRPSKRDLQLLLKIAAQLVLSIQSEEIFRKSSEQHRWLQTLIDQSTVAMYALDGDRFSFVNAKFAAVLGYTKEEILALGSVTEIIVDEQREFVREMIRRRDAGDDSDVRYAAHVRCKDGSIVEAEIHGSAVYVDGRRIIIGAAVDITGQATASRRAKEGKEYFRALTENVSDVIAILDPEGRVTYISPSAERVLRYSAEELTGSSHFALVHPDDRDRVVASFERLVAAGPNPVSCEPYRLRRKDGAWRLLESVGVNLLHHPQVHGLVVSTRDVTERKALEQELEQLHRVTSLGRLAAQVAHEFNNVLMGIQPVVEVIRRYGANNPQLLRFSDLVAASISRGKRITTDILRFGRPAQLTLQPVRVGDLIRQVSEEIRPMLPDRITLSVDTGELLKDVAVSADRAQLSQVLVNLALNARDAMLASGGNLTLGVSPDQPLELQPRFIHFTVTDTGEGIASENLPHIFEPLFSTKKIGTGLGLSVVFQIVAAHGGHISVESEPGIGSTFHLFIRSSVETGSPEEPAVSHQEAELPKAMLETLRVLLVEDDEAVACGLQWILEADGIDVHVVGKGADVMPAMFKLRPDVIVLDLHLPDETGGKVYERIAAHSRVPVIFSSGHAFEREIKELLNNPRVAFLMKPYSADELLRTIHQVLHSKEGV